jgi:hypothetical protein
VLPAASEARAGDASADAAGAHAASDAKHEPVGSAAHDAAKAAAQATLDDEDLNADSTTTVEPRRDEPAKEATP